MDKNKSLVTIVPNPLDPHVGRRQIYCEPGKTIDAIIKEKWPALRGVGMVAVHNGKIVDPDDYKLTVLSEGDFLVLCAKIEGADDNDILRAAGMIIVMAAATYVGGPAGAAFFGGSEFAATVAMATIAVGGSMLVNSLFPAQVPELGGETQPANTYGWTPAENQYLEGIALPILYGTVKVTPAIIQRHITYTSNATVTELNMLYAIAEGPITSVTDIKVNDNSIDNYDNVSTEIKLGTNSQTVIDDFQYGFRETQNVGLELIDNDYVTMQTQGNAVTKFEVVLSFPKGLSRLVDNKYETHSLKYILEYKKTSDPTWTVLPEFPIGGQSYLKTRRFYIRQTVAEGEYDIRVKITSARQEEPEYLEQAWVETLGEYADDIFTYPNTALLGLSALATDQLNGTLPVVSCIATKEFVDVWTGAAYESKSADNPAWACYDLIHNSQYGAGIPYARIDFNEFSNWADFCDLPANAYKVNIYFDTATTLADALAKVSMIGRGSVIQRGTKFGAMFDGTSSPVQLFGIGNIEADSFNETFMEKSNRADVIEVTFNNADDDYLRRTIQITGDGYDTSTEEIRTTQVALDGCTDYDQAAAYAKFLMNCNQYLSRVINFRTDIDGISCQPGDVISVSHDVPQWGNSGRIVSATSNTVVLDQSVSVTTGETYVILVRHDADDTLEEQELVNPGTGSYTSFTLTGTWTTTPAAKTNYAFGKEDLETKPFRVISVKRDDDLRCEISALEYRSEVYSDSVSIPEYEAISDLPQVSSVRADDVYPIGPDGERRIPAIDITWEGFAVLWSVFFKENTENQWMRVAQVNAPSYRLTGIDIGKTYTIAVSATDNPGDGDSDTVTMSIDPPEAITGLSADVSDNFVLLRWQAPESELPIAYYQVKRGDNFATATNIGRADKTFTSFFERVAGTYKYWVAAVNTAGTVGNDGSVTATVSVPTDYEQLSEWASALDGDLTNMRSDPEGIVGPLNDTETWEEHFTNNNNETFQDFIDDGYTYYFEPSYQVTGTYAEGSTDTGATINSATVSLSVDYRILAGDPTSVVLTPTIYSSLDGASWTEYEGVWSKAITNFRYLRYDIDVATANNTLIVITEAKLNLYLRRLEERGTNEVTVAASGKTISFTVPFVDVEAITVTAKGTVGRKTTYDFTDVPNPTDFTAYLFDSNGNKVTGTFSYIVKGV